MAVKKKKAAKQDTSRNDQIVRVLSLLRDLEAMGGCDLYELAQRYSTSTRTIRRDFEALEQAGIPLTKEPGEGARVRWSIDSHANTIATRLLNYSHFLALKLAMSEGLAVKKQGQLFASLEELSVRIEQAVGPQGRQKLLEIDRCFFSWDKFAMRKAPLDVVWQLLDAISHRKKCVVQYRAPSSGNQERTFPVLPLRLFVHNGALYLHAWQPKFQAVLPLNLHRLQKLQVTEEILPVPPEYDAGKLEATAFGIFIGPQPQRFELRFDAFARPYIEERQWHPTQTLTPQPDGGTLLTFECAPSYEVTNWVASWRAHVQILKPETLRTELFAYGAWLLDQYAGSGPR